jgi:FG-GAP-like repeat/FG-GAP repeat
VHSIGWIAQTHPGVPVPRFLSSVVLCVCTLLGSIGGAQTTATHTTTANVQFLGGTASLATSAASPTGPAFTTSPFSTYFGAPIDQSFTNIQGQVTADLNGDGAPDLLVYQIVNNGASPNVIRVQSFISNGKSGFTALAPQQLTLPATTSANVAVTSTPPAIDVNGDGKLDLLIGTAAAYGNGDGTFQQPVTPAFLSTGFGGTYAADVTGDGKPDIIAVNAIPLASLGQEANIPLAVTVFANQGGGNFQSLGAFTLGAGQYSGSVALASLSFVDLNGDGKLDIVAQMYFVGMGNAAAPATIATLLNNGDGTLATAQPASYTTQQNGGSIELLSVQAADFNGDGKVDLALIYPPPQQTSLTYLSQIIFLPGNGDGSFGTEINSTISTTEQAGVASAQPPAGNAVVTDANLDGALDLVFGSGAVAVGDGKGDFSAGTPVVEVSIPSIPAAFNYFNIASLGTIQPAGSTYPDLVFAAPSVAASAPFPLVAVSNSSAFAVQSSGGSPSVTVTSGQSASVSLSVTGAASYTGSVTLTCAGLPPGASCSFNPATLNLAGGTPQSSTLTVSTAAGNMAGMVPPFLGPGMTTLGCGIFAGSLLLFWPKRRRAYWMIVALAGFTLLPLGCGGNGSSSASKSNNTSAGTYTFQVIATAGTTQSKTSCTLIVQ